MPLVVPIEPGQDNYWTIGGSPISYAAWTYYLCNIRGKIMIIS